MLLRAIRGSIWISRAAAPAAFACGTALAQRPIETSPVVAKASPEDVAAGGKLYEATCSKCHGRDGGGGDGPSLQGATERLGDAEVGSIIRGGIPGTGMNGFGSLNIYETGQVVG